MRQYGWPHSALGAGASPLYHSDAGDDVAAGAALDHQPARRAAQGWPGGCLPERLEPVVDESGAHAPNQPADHRPNLLPRTAKPVLPYALADQYAAGRAGYGA